jgi:glycosyltransferase involved in cell wall biosynthesis
MPPPSDLAIVIPALNEAESIAAVVGEIRAAVAARVIVVDGGSSDATARRAREAGAQVVDAGRGYGRACLAGAEAAEGAALVVFMDGDGADDPAVIPSLVEAIENGACDFALASRARGERAPGSMAAHQLLAGFVAGWLTKLLYGVRYTDMCALRAIRRDVLLGLGMRELTYGWNLEMQMRAARAGLRILEIPVSYRRRLGGQSKVAGSLRGSLKAGLRICGTFVRVAVEPLAGRAAP